jgi:hypothetical protein
LVHIDIWGSFYVSSYSSYRFFLTILMITLDSLGYS